MSTTEQPGYATIAIASNELWSANSVFSVNAYPEDLSSIVNSCALRLGMLSVLAPGLAHAVNQEWQKLQAELLANRGGLWEWAFKSQIQIVAFSDGLQYLGTLYSFLMTAKYFLDVYAMLMGKLIGRHLSWSFKSGKVDQASISGGAVINWLRKSAPKELGTSTELAAIIEQHSKTWITELVGYRDTIAHYSEIPKSIHLGVPLRISPPIFDPNDIQVPALPNVCERPPYAFGVLDHLRDFVSQTVSKLPNVDMNKIHLDLLNLRPHERK